MISDIAALVFMAVVIAVTAFSLWLLNHRRNFLLPRIYFGVSLSYTVWVVALLSMKYTSPDNARLYHCAGLPHNYPDLFHSPTRTPTWLF